MAETMAVMRAEMKVVSSVFSRAGKTVVTMEQKKVAARAAVKVVCLAERKVNVLVARRVEK